MLLLLVVVLLLGRGAPVGGGAAAGDGVPSVLLEPSAFPDADSFFFEELSSEGIPAARSASEVIVQRR